jgi:vacuolar-type H+-ATPase subunit E/Vma4
MNEEVKVPPMEDNLISGILKDAQEEARRIVEEARAEAARKLEQARQRLGCLRESEAKAHAQCEAIRKSAAQGIAVETKRISLRQRKRPSPPYLSA